MWVVRLELTSVRLMDKAEQGNRQQLSGVIMKASYGEMREGREGETCASAIDFPFDLGSPDTRKERRYLQTEASAVASDRDWNKMLGSTPHLLRP